VIWSSTSSLLQRSCSHPRTISEQGVRPGTHDRNPRPMRARGGWPGGRLPLVQRSQLPPRCRRDRFAPDALADAAGSDRRLALAVESVIAGAGHRESTGCARRCGPGSARGRTTGKRLSRCWMPERTSWWSCARAAQEGERCSDGPAHRGGLHGSRRADHSPDAPPRAGGRASARGRD
jgi:hypothetical protein